MEFVYLMIVTAAIGTIAFLATVVWELRKSKKQVHF